MNFCLNINLSWKPQRSITFVRSILEGVWVSEENAPEQLRDIALDRPSSQVVIQLAEDENTNTTDDTDDDYRRKLNLTATC